MKTQTIISEARQANAIFAYTINQGLLSLELKIIIVRFICYFVSK